MWAVIPVAGRGTRIAPVARGLPKALLEIHGESLLARLISDIEEAVSGICIVIPPPSEGGTRLTGALNSLDVSVPLETVTQTERHGVADAVWQCRYRLHGPFVVIMGDVYYDAPLAPYVAALEATQLPAVLIEPVSESTPVPAGVVAVDDGRVTTIEKRPVRDSDAFRVAGAFAFSPHDFAVFETARPGSGEFELEDVLDVLLRERPVSAVVYEGWRRNVNCPEDLRAVRESDAPDLPP